MDELLYEIAQTLEFKRKRANLQVAALKALLVNIYHGYEAIEPVAISGDKSTYTNQGRYVSDQRTA